VQTNKNSPDYCYCIEFIRKKMNNRTVIGKIVERMIIGVNDFDKGFVIRRIEGCRRP
jgi:hypothetical protein